MRQVKIINKCISIDVKPIRLPGPSGGDYFCPLSNCFPSASYQNLSQYSKQMTQVMINNKCISIDEKSLLPGPSGGDPFCLLANCFLFSWLCLFFALVLDFKDPIQNRDKVSARLLKAELIWF